VGSDDPDQAGTPSYSEKSFEDLLRKIAPYASQILDEWFKIPREKRLEILAHGQTAVALLTLVASQTTAESAKKLAKSSEEISLLTKWLVGITLVLTVLTAVLLWRTFLS